MTGMAPENPFEKILYDTVYQAWSDTLRVAVLLGPAIPAFFVNWDRMDANSVAFIAVGAVVTQVVGLVIVPDWLASRAASQKLAAARRDKKLPEWNPPNREQAALEEASIVNYRFSYVRRKGYGGGVVHDHHSAISRAVREEDFVRLRQLTVHIALCEELNEERRRKAATYARRLFCEAMLKDVPHASLFWRITPKDYCDTLVSELTRQGWPADPMDFQTN